MDESKVKKVAFAIYLKLKDHIPSTVFCWDELTEEEKAMFEDMARAALTVKV